MARPRSIQVHLVNEMRFHAGNQRSDPFSQPWEGWRTRHDSNVWPPPSEGGAYPAELRVHQYSDSVRDRAGSIPNPAIEPARTQRASVPDRAFRRARRQIQNEDG